MNALVAGNGSYILRPCGHDLHGPTQSMGRDSPFLIARTQMILIACNIEKFPNS